MYLENIDDDSMIEDSTNMMIFIPSISDQSIDKIEDFGNFEESTTDSEVNHLIESIRLKLDEHKDHGFEDDE